MNTVTSLFLSPRGRIGRKPFIIAIVIWCLFYAVQYLWFQKTGENTLNFFLALGLMVFNIHIIFCVFGKRLHDLGRSTWSLIGVFMFVLIAAIFVMLNYGGLEYFDTIMQNPDKQNDPIFMDEVHKVYQENLSKNLHKIGPLLLLIPALFIVLIAAKSGQNSANRYGLPTGKINSAEEAHE